MRISGFSKKDIKGIPHLLILDIGTQFVKAVLFGVDFEKDEIIIKGTGKAKHESPPHLTYGESRQQEKEAIINIVGIQQSCKEAILKAEKMAGFPVEQVILGTAGGLIEGSTITVDYRRERPETKIDLLELQHILQKIQWRVFDDIKKEFTKEFSQPEMSLKLINASVADVKVDNYSISSPLGFKGKEISLAISNTYAPLISLKAIKDLILQLGLDLLGIVPEHYAVLHSLRIKKSPEFNAIFIDIGGSSTNISLIQEGKLEGRKVFDIGGRSFTKSLASYLKVGIPEAEEIKIKYIRKELGLKVMREFRKVFRSDISVWLLGVDLALGEFDKGAVPESSLPAQIFLFGGGSMLRDIKESLNKRDWPSSLRFDVNPKVNSISPQDIVNIKDKANLLKEADDVSSLALAAFSLDLLKEEGVFHPILKRIIRIMQK